MPAKRLRVNGVVQGVGFRPFVYGLALRHGLRGWVCNTSSGVDIQIEGGTFAIEKFITALTTEAPPLAQIDSVRINDADPESPDGFEIRHSVQEQGAFQPISADVATCDDCRRELFDSSDRRYLYPFINCTNCGPRFTIIRDLPYDRPFTTMAGFPMCPDCLAEYDDPLDRRFHAQPVACPACGPQVWLQADAASAEKSRGLEAILAARRLLREGKIVAIRGLGGFHLACDAGNARAVAELRRRKGRAGKPFALMAASQSALEQIVEADERDMDVLVSRQKPVVLVRKRAGARLAEQIAPGVDTYGVMLPYTPLHALLLEQENPELAAEPVPAVLVMTSGNFSEEPIATTNEEALNRLAPLADAFLLHDREIETRCDDSVLRVYNFPEESRGPMNKEIPLVFLRRSRGYAPYPVQLPFAVPPLLAVGGELKNVFCLARERYAFLSHHIGDMENLETYTAFERGVEHLGRLFRVQPELIAYDLHPAYLSTKYALGVEGDHRRVGVQHHHAHIAACMADNGLDGSEAVIGLSYDGTGYGLDGAIWGGEVLVADYRQFERAGQLEYLPLPGGDAAIRNPWRTAVGYAAALELQIDGLPFLEKVDPQAVRMVRDQAVKGLNSPRTSSLGRLFDAVAVLAGGPVEASYEAQAAIELEALSHTQAAVGAYPFAIETNSNGGLALKLRELLAAVIRDARKGTSGAVIGRRFHQTVADFSVEICIAIRARTGLKTVALSGGVWQNQLLLDLVRAGLQAQGFSVLTHRQTPANDGGLALGQAVVAAVREGVNG